MKIKLKLPLNKALELKILIPMMNELSIAKMSNIPIDLSITPLMSSVDENLLNNLHAKNFKS